MPTVIRNEADVEQGLTALLMIDPRLSPIADMVGPLPLRLREPGFAGLAHVVVSQMVSRASANAIWRRITEGAGEDITATAYLAATASVETPRFGLSRAKAKTLHGIATSITEGKLDLEALNNMEDTLAFTELTALSGVGPWTAQVYLMFCGGHADVFPTGDIALQAAVADAFKMNARPSGKELAEFAECWSPWRSVAARLFWAHYARITRREALPIA